MDITAVQKALPPPGHIDVSYPRDNSHLVITWNEVRNKSLPKIGYNIYKGLTRNGIFYKLNNKPLNNNRYEDYNISRNPNVQNWYKISSVYMNDGEYVEGNLSNAQCFEIHNTDRWFLKMNERSFWILKNTGMLFDLYTRKYDGERCTRCFDKIRGQAGTQDCPVCYGTGFVGGYDPVYQLYVRLKPAQVSLNLSPTMYVQQNSPGAWTITKTKIMNRDILIGPDATIYQVLRSQINQAGGYLFHTELELRAYDPRDPIYQMKRSTLYPMELW